MASGKSLFGAVVGRFFFREVSTTAIEELGPSYRRIAFAGESLRDVAWEAGDKIQVYLPSAGMRTYTPMTWSGDRAELLVFVHGQSPGASWGRRLSVGESWQFFGPRRSIRASELGPRIVLFGDETSLAVARSFADAKGAANVRSVFEVTDEGESKMVLDAIGLEHTATLARQPADAHLERTCDALVEAMDSTQGGSLVMTGRAQSIQLLRARLKARNALRSGKVKAYWSVGKSGLD
jgi:NADPH-dependent ferric siderophore reductase